MAKAKPLTKEQMVAAQSKTLSNMAAARYLHVSYQHYKKWAKLYKIFESHKNQAGVGVPKFLKGSKKMPHMIEIIEGRIAASHFDVQLLCYNHYFLQVGDIFNKKDEQQIESQQEHYGTSETINFEVDDYHLQRLKELGLDGDETDDTEQYISRI